MGRLVQPPDDFTPTGPTVFLAGPIQGGPDWHPWAIQKLLEAGGVGDLTVASPSRSLHEWDFDYERQVDWETVWLRRAAENGVILFWMAKEETHTCTRSYAQTTRFEFAEWKERARMGKATLAVGIEPGYTGERYIRYRVGKELGELHIHSTLADTVDSALSILRYRARVLP